MNLTERNQVIVPGKETGNEPWADFKAQRVVAGQEKLHMPPGQDIQEVREAFSGTIVPDGHNDETKITDAQSVVKGYHKHPMKPYDDQYTGEHTDPFYDNPEVDGKSDGFVERNNYLDRG